MSRGVLWTFAVLAYAAGFAIGHGRRGWQALKRRVAPCADWRKVEVEGLSIRLPPDWGEVELDPRGGFVVHNRPRRFRIDGDAVWYSSAMELSIRGGSDAANRPDPEAMTVVRRTVSRQGLTTKLELAVSNGVGPRQRGIAVRILKSVTPSRSAGVATTTFPQGFDGTPRPSGPIRHRTTSEDDP